jgi:hypothetical protein
MVVENDDQPGATQRLDDGIQHLQRSLADEPWIRRQHARLNHGISGDELVTPRQADRIEP